jgi:hypothetical protein
MSGVFDLNPATSYFPTPERCSIIGSSRLNFRVRDGNGCDPTDKITGKLAGSGQMAVCRSEPAFAAAVVNFKVDSCLKFSMQSPY